MLVVTELTVLIEVAELLAVATSRSVELESPQEVVGLLEVRTNSVDLVDCVLLGVDTELAEDLLNELIVGKGNSLTVDLSITSLVDEGADGLEVGITVHDVGLDSTEHLNGRLVELNKDGVVDLSETEELKDLADLGVSLVDTTDSGDNGELTLGLEEVTTSLTGLSSLLDEVSVHLLVLSSILLSTLKSQLSALSLSLFDLLGGLLVLSLEVSITLLLQLDGLRTRRT